MAFCFSVFFSFASLSITVLHLLSYPCCERPVYFKLRETQCFCMEKRLEAKNKKALNISFTYVRKKTIHVKCFVCLVVSFLLDQWNSCCCAAPTQASAACSRKQGRCMHRHTSANPPRVTLELLCFPLTSSSELLSTLCLLSAGCFARLRFLRT